MYRHYLILITLTFFSISSLATNYSDPARFSNEVSILKEKNKRFLHTKNIVFSGSSTIRLWQQFMPTKFGDLNTVNSGFGGSNANDLLHFIEPLILDYNPEIVVIYEGDNDVAHGVSEEDILLRYHSIIDRIHQSNSKTTVFLIGVKPSPSRWSLWPTMQSVNQKLRALAHHNKKVGFISINSYFLNQGVPAPQFFVDDGLHYNQLGYQQWNKAINQVIEEFLERRKLD